MRGWRIAALVALSLSSQTPAQAQRGHSIQAGVITEFEDATMLLGYRWTGARQGRVGLDFSINTLPQAFSEAFVGLLDFDLTAPIGIGSRSWLLPRAGLTVLVAAGEIAGAAPGLNLGLGWLGRTGERTGIRLDATYTRFLTDDDDEAGFTALTLGFVWLK